VNRHTAIRCLLDTAGSGPIVASVGHASYDLFAVEDRPANFYTWGSMGLASSIGLGLALSRPNLRVFVIDGDGSLLMNLGSLATIGWSRPANLVILVLDNQQYATTGGQESATGYGADLAAAARALRIARTATVETEDELRATLALTSDQEGPWVIVANITESAAQQRQPADCVFTKQRFMAAIGGPEAATFGGPA
jgi:thiamine pyrophosphate-dependent acetolactate synthase large subunit-like protein